MTTAIYCRVSTTSQNLEGQKRKITEWLNGNGITEAQWFIDKATGANTDRPGFKDLQTAVFNGTIKTIVVWKLDRLSRSMVEGINIIQGWLKSNVRVVSVTQQLDFAGVTGKLVASVLFAVAEMETELRKERQQAGIEVAKAENKYEGRKRGSIIRKRGPHRAHELRSQGHTYREIANALNVSVGTVSNYLKAAEQK